MQPNNSNLSNFSSILYSPFTKPTRLLSEYIEIAILTVCFAIGAPLNTYAFYNTLRVYSSRRKTVRLLTLKLHLNVADLMIIWIFALSEIIWMSAFQWYGGDLLCRLVKFFHNFSFFLISNMIVCIAIDRVYTTYHIKDANIKYRISVKWLVKIAYCLAILFSTPQLYIYRMVEAFPQWYQCVAVWTVYKVEARGHEIEMWEKLYSWCHIVLVFWLPATIILICYVLIIRKLKETIHRDDLFSEGTTNEANGNLTLPLVEVVAETKSAGNLELPNNNLRPRTNTSNSNTSAPPIFKRGVSVDYSPSVTSRTSSQNCRRCASIDSRSSKETKIRQQEVTPLRRSTRTLHRAKQKTLRKATLIIVAYVIFWFPYNVLTLIHTIDNSFSMGLLDNVAFLNCLIVVNSIVNPLIYGISL